MVEPALHQLDRLGLLESHHIHRAWLGILVANHQVELTKVIGHVVADPVDEGIGVDLADRARLDFLELLFFADLEHQLV
jgi:hypothetical protein